MRIVSGFPLAPSSFGRCIWVLRRSRGRPNAASTSVACVVGSAYWPVVPVESDFRTECVTGSCSRKGPPPGGSVIHRRRILAAADSSQSYVLTERTQSCETATLLREGGFDSEHCSSRLCNQTVQPRGFLHVPQVPGYLNERGTLGRLRPLVRPHFELARPSRLSYLQPRHRCNSLRNHPLCRVRGLRVRRHAVPDAINRYAHGRTPVHAGESRQTGA